MKTILKIIGILILIVVVYGIIAILAFDKNYHYEKSIVINAPKEQVWQHTGSLKAYNVWDPFSKADKNVKMTYSGTSGEVGDSYHWLGNKDVGEGKQTVTEIVPNEKMVTQLQFIKPWEGFAKATFTLTPEGNSTKVTWTIDNELTPMMKPMKPMMDMQMEKMFEQGLGDLKKICEK